MLIEKKNLIKLCSRGLLLNHRSAALPDFSVFLFTDYGNKLKAKHVNKKERNLNETETKKEGTMN